MKIFGLGGTNGAGKDTVGELLAERHGYLFVSMSDMLRAEAKKRNKPVEREVLRTISAEWRRESGVGVLVDKVIEYLEEQGRDYPGVIMASVRNPGEADRIHELGGKMIWVDADPKVRYGRIFSRQRTAEDNKSFEEFVAEEEAEMQASGDSATLDMSAVKAKSDITLTNNGNDIAVFKDDAEQQLAPHL